MYVYQPYPKHLHRPDGSFKVVENDAERDAALAEGWNLKSGPVPEPVLQPEMESPAELPDLSEAQEPEKRKPGRPKKKG